MKKEKIKVKDLINILKDLDQDALIIISQDAEGNAFSPLYSVEELCYEGSNGDIFLLDEKEEGERGK